MAGHRNPPTTPNSGGNRLTALWGGIETGTKAVFGAGRTAVKETVQWHKDLNTRNKVKVFGAEAVAIAFGIGVGVGNYLVAPDDGGSNGNSVSAPHFRGASECPPGYFSHMRVTNPSEFIRAFVTKKIELINKRDNLQAHHIQTPLTDRVINDLPSNPNDMVSELECTVPEGTAPFNASGQSIIVESPREVGLEAELDGLHSPIDLSKAVTYVKSAPQVEVH